ncbi:MAG: sigma-70 family RNA polymerase sigma factor [Saprospiraceae bacterium]
MKIPENIFHGCLSGNRKAQEMLFQICYGDCIKIALKYTASMDDAKEVVNSALFKVFTKISDFSGNHNNFYGWIKRIVINQSLDYIRVHQKTNIVGIEHAEPIVFKDHTNFVDSSTIFDLIHQLPETTKKVFNLYAIDGYSHKEVSEICQISESNSKYHVFAARKLLKEMLFKIEL